MKKQILSNLAYKILILTIFSLITFTFLNSIAFAKNSSYTPLYQSQLDYDEEYDEEEEPDDTHLVSESKRKKYVYLTFDDGPDPKTTPKILDTLKSENVKATFFVIGQNINYYKKTFKRIVDEGHELGLHSYTHNLKTVYASENSFISEMEKSQKLIKSITGKDVTILRFPGGTPKRMTSSLRTKLHNKNYKIYDWHSSVDDGMKPRTSADNLVKNALSYKTKTKNIIVLLHSRPNNATTAEALPTLIKHYKSLGYEFKTISPSTPEFYFYCK